MSKIDEILKKSLQGKVATDSKLGPEQESITSNGLVDYAQIRSLAEEDGLSPVADVRFVPSTPHDYANQSIITPTNVPRRFRRWKEAALVFGADLFSEGDDLDLINTGSFESQEGVVFSANFNQSPNFAAITDTYLMTHREDLDNATARTNLRAHRVSASAGDQIDLATTTYNIGDGGATYRWSHYGFYPPKLLPLPNSDGEVTAYAAILPEDWPVFSWTQEYQDNTFGSALTKTNVSGVDIINFNAEIIGIETPAGSVAIDDYILVEGRIFYVQNVSNLGATDAVFGVPLHPFEVDGIELLVGVDIQILYTVGELTASPGDSVGTDAFGNTIPALYDSPMLDWIRVRRLYPPASSNSNRSLLSAFVDATFNDQIGLAPALIPSQAGGDFELAVNGLANFSSITLDPAVEEDQEVLVDYREGIFHLSHPIAAGSDLNPNSYLDANGYPRLYAVFASYNGPSLPVSVLELKGENRAELTRVPLVGEERTPVAGLTGWKVTVGDENTNGRGDYYYYPIQDIAPTTDVNYGGRAEAIYLLESNTAHSQGPLLVFQKRSDIDAAVQVGAIAYNGRGGSDADDSAQFTFIPDIGDGASAITSTNKPDFRIATTKALVSVSNDLYFSVAPGDVLAGTLNGVDFSIALIDDATDGADAGVPATGINVTDGQRSIPELIEEIIAGMPVGLVFGEDYFLSYYYDGSDYIWVFEASSSLVIDTDDATLFPSSTGTPGDIKLVFGYNRAVEAVLRYVRRENELFFDGQAIRVQQAKLGVPPKSSWVYEGFDIIEQSVEGGTAFLSLEPGTVITPEGPVRIDEDFRVTLTADQRIGIYFDTSTGTVATVNQLAGDDSPFTLIAEEDIPLYIAKIDAVPAFEYVVDVRDFLKNEEMSHIITVGTEGRVSTLAGGLELAKKISFTTGNHPVIELLEDQTLDLDDVNTDAYAPIQPVPYNGAPIALPQNITIRGNGRLVTITGVPNETGGLGDPIFRSNQDAGDLSHVTFENIEFRIAGGQPDVSLMAANYANSGTMRFVDVTLSTAGLAKFNLFGATNDNNAIQDEVILDNVKVYGAISLRKVTRFIARDVYLTSPDTEIFSLISTDTDSVMHIEGVSSALSTGFVGSIFLQDDADVTVSGFRGFSLTVAPEPASNITGAKVYLENIELGSQMILGNGTNTISGSTVTLDGLTISNATATTPLTLNQITQTTLKTLNLNSDADVTLDVIDSDMDLSEFIINNTSASTGVTTKIGIRLQGDNGALVNGVNAMDSDILIENGIITSDAGSGIYVAKANESGKETIIRHNRFINATDSTLNSRGVTLNADAGTASADNVDEVHIAYNVFDRYSVDGGNDSYAISTQGVSDVNHGEVTIVFNHVRGFVAGATAFDNLANALTSNNAFTA